MAWVWGGRVGGRGGPSGRSAGQGRPGTGVYSGFFLFVYVALVPPSSRVPRQEVFLDRDPPHSWAGPGDAALLRLRRVRSGTLECRGDRFGGDHLVVDCVTM